MEVAGGSGPGTSSSRLPRGLPHSLKERRARSAEVLASRTRPGGVEDDDQALVAVGGDRLAEDAGGVVAAGRADPPEEAVAGGWRLTDGDLHLGRFGRPPGRQELLSIRLAAVEDELAHAAVVTQRHGDAAANALVAGRTDQPDGVPFHAVGLPDLLRGVFR